MVQLCIDLKLGSTAFDFVTTRTLPVLRRLLTSYLDIFFVLVYDSRFQSDVPYLGRVWRGCYWSRSCFVGSSSSDLCLSRIISHSDMKINLGKNECRYKSERYTCRNESKMSKD